MSLNINQTTDTLTPTTGTVNVVGTLTVNGSPPGGAPTFVVLGSNVTSTSTTNANVGGGMTFTAQANKTYIVNLLAIVQQDANTANPIFLLDVPDGTVTGFNSFGGNTQVFPVVNEQNADDVAAAIQANGLRANASNYPLSAQWVYNAGGTGGAVNLRIRIRSTGTGTLVAGSVFSWQLVN